MAYDYSSESQRLELPNPYRIENLFQFAVSAFYLICGLLSLLAARSNLTGLNIKFAVPVIAGILLIAYGIRCGATGMTRLRFFFGRALPVGLAPELQHGMTGKSQHIDAVQDDLRRGALSFPEPAGALNGLLYDRFPRLILAPLPVQQLAQSQFRNGLVIALTLVSLLVAWMGFSQPQTAQWVGLFYFTFAAWLVLRPMTVEQQASVNETGIIALVVAAVIGPVIIALFARSLPELHWLTLHWQALFLLLAALGSVALFFVALIRQLSAPPATNMSCEVLSLNINTHPGQIINEFDRVMQQKWVEKIPNRRYARIDPVVDSSTATGSFSGEIVEETQPVPAEVLSALSLPAALAGARSRWLVILNLYGLAMLCAGAVALLLFVMRFEAGTFELSIVAYLTFAFVAFSVGRFCFRSSEKLWGRFDFVSEVIWLELAGQYTTARNRLGNDFSSTVRTESNGIHVDAMTMRVWTARIESVVFGKDQKRWITAMNGQSDITSGLAAHLSEFARARSMFVAPTNADDLGKIAATQSGQAAQATVAQVLQDLVPPVAVASAENFCGECGAARLSEARFCSGCGGKFA
ncbi:zinc ribbon domain-containing protein [Actimicrobium sp. CCC2.4]|uniref:zinc ribbon domain-containing protein n=1 Tax=Actimicrobium sp. CCC2.4 TaxID=3048606 RepID=UPI002AC9C618|nr:zinc ribbon domain-containing protein [Actimicrobium sp. CCC2.4]MEB0134539.1 zinc ribbon domain-containing protein [Actimicrobium sp. CCC2.4]WPX33982.1 zinc ribbon domain-containing protein [Actimicrobium sp. CCC2.4]